MLHIVNKSHNQTRSLESCLRLAQPGQTGEIVVRISLVMRGYHRDPEATAHASAHGWHHTGDIGYLDPDNFLFIVDRAKDMVITGGFNVYSTEVEQAIMQHPAIQDCAVVGLPDDRWGERVTAVVRLRPGFTIQPEELKAFVKQRLGAIKTPKQVEIWDDLPRSKVGKVLKQEIKRSLTAGSSSILPDRPEHRGQGAISRVPGQSSPQGGR